MQINKKWNCSEFIDISISGRSQQLHSIITSYQSFKPKCGSIMVWGFFASSRPGYLTIIEQTMNSYPNQKILLENFRLFIHQPACKLLIQMGGAFILNIQEKRFLRRTISVLGEEKIKVQTKFHRNVVSVTDVSSSC